MESRILKFRIFKDGKMHEPFDLRDLHSHGIAADAVVMQFTGLLDENSVEIYEGDVLRSPDWACDSIVKWHNGGFVSPQGDMSYTLGYEMDQHYSDYPQTNISVIGNIWESPELVK